MKNFWKKAVGNKKFMIALVLAAVFMIIALLSEKIVPFDIYQQDFYNMSQPPGNGHIAGTDNIGRDLFSRILVGSRYSLVYTFVMVILTMLIGTAIGMIAGYSGGIVDMLPMRLTDMVLSLPVQVFAIAIITVMGPGIINLIISISVLWWTRCARMVRNRVAGIRKAEYVEEAVMGGESTFRLLTRYILPNILPDILVLAALDISTVMLALASFSYLGLSAQPPTPEWGYMLSEGKRYIQEAPWMTIYPSIAMFITVVIFNLLGDGFRDVMDPRYDNDRAGRRRRIRRAARAARKSQDSRQRN